MRNISRLQCHTISGGHDLDFELFIGGSVFGFAITNSLATLDHLGLIDNHRIADTIITGSILGLCFGYPSFMFASKFY